MTRVVSVRGRERAALERDESFLYVGRAVPRRGWAASPFGNPFSVDCWGAGEAVRLFEACLDAALAGTPPPPEAGLLIGPYAWPGYFREMAAILPGLRGRTLGCWCGAWSPEDGEPAFACHAVALARRAEALDGRRS